jgi:predicted nicotinamide N-methyase
MSQQDGETTKTMLGYPDVVDDVPAEFRSHGPPTESSALVDLFAGEDEEEDPSAEDSAIRRVTIAGQLYHLPIPPSTGTLFADQIWSGSLYLAAYLAEHADLYCRGQRTVEFGAASALPSLVALKHGSAASVLTDFPEDDLLASIRSTVGVNWTTFGQPHGRVAVLGHEWGTDTSPVQQALRELVATGTTTSVATAVDPPCLFDTAVLSECLWVMKVPIWHSFNSASVPTISSRFTPNRGWGPTNGEKTRRLKCIYASCGESRG